MQSTSALTHPNTVAIYDYGIADDGTFYYRYASAAELERALVSM